MKTLKGGLYRARCGAVLLREIGPWLTVKGLPGGEGHSTTVFPDYGRVSVGDTWYVSGSCRIPSHPMHPVERIKP